MVVAVATIFLACINSHVANRVALDEFLSFILLLQRSDDVRQRFASLPDRASRGRMMSQLGFDKHRIWAALEMVTFEHEGETLTLSSWIRDKKRRANGSSVPFSTILSSARALGADDVHASIRLQLLQIQGTLSSVAGGASRPGHFQPSMSTDGPSVRQRRLEFDPVDAGHDLDVNHSLNLDSDGLLDASDSELVGDRSTSLGFPDDVFETDQHQEFVSNSLIDGPLSDRASESLVPDQMHASLEDQQRSDSTSAPQTGELQGTTVSPQNDADSVGDSRSQEITNRSSVESPSTSPSDLLGDLTSEWRQDLDQRISIPVDWSSETIDIYDGQYTDLTLTLSIGGTLNPSIEGDRQGGYSLSLEQSNLDFNVTLGVSGTYSKEIPRYDLQLSATLSTAVTLTLEKNPGQQGISGYHISASGVQLEMVAGLIVNPQYNGLVLSASIDPELSWTIDASMKGGIDVGRPQFDLNFEYSIDKPSWGEAFEKVFNEFADTWEDFFTNPSWNNFVDSVNSFVTLGEFLTSPQFMSAVYGVATDYVNQAMTDAANLAVSVVGTLSSEITSTLTDTADAVTDAATDVATDTADAATDVANDTADAATDVANDTADAATDAANETADAATDAANETADAATDAVNDVSSSLGF